MFIKNGLLQNAGEELPSREQALVGVVDFDLSNFSKNVIHDL